MSSKTSPLRDAPLSKQGDLEALSQAATEGPWFLHDFADPAVSADPSPEDVTISCDHPATITVALMGRALTATLDEARANAAYIVALANAHRSGILRLASAPAVPAPPAGTSESPWSFDMEAAPRDKPILAWCDHEADPHSEDGGKTLTLYAAHAEGMSHAPTGRHIIEWGGAFDETAEWGGSLPDWWFVAGSQFEVAANPIAWCLIPDPPSRPQTKEAGASDA